MTPLVSVEEVTKDYFRGSERVQALRRANLHLQRGEFVGLMGPSGSGKSTLLNIIAGLDHPTSGRVVIDGDVISEFSDAELTRWRVASIGFIFQFYHLVPVLTAWENVELPLLMMNLSADRRYDQVETALDLVGLSHRGRHRPGQLSGGEQQRVGIARALVTDPTLIVADEPTGDLDTKRSAEILDLLQDLQQSLGKTVLMVTHDPTAASRTERLYRIEDGHLEESDPRMAAVPRASVRTASPARRVSH